jgi:hypothetical protein
LTAAVELNQPAAWADFQLITYLAQQVALIKVELDAMAAVAVVVDTSAAAVVVTMLAAAADQDLLVVPESLVH